LADLLTVSLGPIESSDYITTVVFEEVEEPTEESNNLGLELLMLPELMAGFVYGMVGDNHLEEMQTCYAGVTPLYDILDAAFTSIEGWHFLTS